LREITIKNRRAFTLIEVIVSVILISGVILGILKLLEESRSQAVYISQRNLVALQDSLYLTPNSLKYHKENKDAYTILDPYFKIDNFNSKKILKEITRDIFIPEPLTISLFDDGEEGPKAIIDEIMLKDRYSSFYFRFKISGF
jgi:prepilin-type N-terminal cleavage/methylation domain-containing protein